MANSKFHAAAWALPRRILGSADGERYGRVLTLALPAVGEQLLNMMVGLVDTFLVGHLGAASVAAARRLRGRVANRNVGLILSGGNITMDGLRAILSPAGDGHAPA